MSKNNGLNLSVSKFQKSVVSYYKNAGRGHLPWRKTRDPYRILVSEIMLQQTQVDRVIPYYARFLKMFPNVSALAQASLTDVLREWSGLGYNRRAKFLHEAAKVVEARFKGKMPRTREELESLPGVGPYTARAVRVYAYNQPEVFVETNVRTVFIHHFFPRGRKVSDARLVPLIEMSLKNQDPREWYSALMDYGTYLKSQHSNPSRKSKHHVRQSKFDGSLRQVRGAIVRATLQGTPMYEVQTKFPKLYTKARQSLKKDGLL